MAANTKHVTREEICTAVERAIQAAADRGDALPDEWVAALRRAARTQKRFLVGLFHNEDLTCSCPVGYAALDLYGQSFYKLDECPQFAPHDGIGEFFYEFDMCFNDTNALYLVVRDG
jgi:hypothetical protein